MKKKTDTSNAQTKKEKPSNKSNMSLFPKSGKKIKMPKRLARTAQDTIPWIEAYTNGVFQTEPGRFTKTYLFDDISFKTKSEEEEYEIYENYMRFLNSVRPGEDIFLHLVNYSEGTESKIQSILPVLTGDEFDVYRAEMARVITDNAKNTRNNITTKKYITVRVESDDVADAMEKIKASGGEVENNFRKCTKSSVKELDLANRLELFNLILNDGNNDSFYFLHDKDGHTTLDYERLRKEGKSVKEILLSGGLKFYTNHFDIGERVGQVYYLDSFANWVNSNFLAELSELNFESTITVHIEAIPQQTAMQLLHNKSVAVTAEIINRQKKNLNSNVSPEFISIDLKNAKEQIESLQEDLRNRDQKLFYTSIVMVHFADNMDILKEQEKEIRTVAGKFGHHMSNMLYMQERGLRSALPTGIDDTFGKKPATTESLGTLVPFDEVNVFDKGGFYYGVNQINKSLIIHNRTKGQNYNGLYLGSSGSGKSFSAKREMSNAIWNTKSEICIIDPDGEYGPMAEASHGEIIKIAPGNGVYINPFDLDIDISSDSEFNPLLMKIDFICGMLETMKNDGLPLTSVERSVVIKAINRMYQPYIAHLNEMPPGPDGKRLTIDREHCPTMQDLFADLLSSDVEEAQQLALCMETYTTGAFDTFAHKTNVDVNNRVIVYDIKNIGDNLRELALKICTNDIWNRLVANKREGKWTWIYIDEFHLLLANPSTANFLKTVWKRARKWQGVPTGITQNMEEMLASPEARAIINNSSFVYMLNQSKIDRDILQDILKLTDADMEFVTNAEVGSGLIYTGKQTIPFVDHFPQDTKLYHLYSTKAEED